LPKNKIAFKDIHEKKKHFHRGSRRGLRPRIFGLYRMRGLQFKQSKRSGASFQLVFANNRQGLSALYDRG